MIINEKAIAKAMAFHVLSIKTFAIVGNKDKVEPLYSFITTYAL